MAHGKVTFRGQEYVGELLCLYTYPRKVADDRGRVTETVIVPQRVGLLIDGVVTHFTVPSEAEDANGKR